MPEVAEVKYLDPFSGELVEPNPLDVSDEQKLYIQMILDTACSDSRFAKKAYLAIMKVLLGEALLPILTSLTPSEEVAGNPSVPVIVAGENFESGSVVLQAGAPVNTNFSSDTELNATLDLSGASEGTLAISVRNSNGQTSNVVNFTVTAPAMSSQSITPVPPKPKTEASYEKSFTSEGRGKK